MLINGMNEISNEHFCDPDVAVEEAKACVFNKDGNPSYSTASWLAQLRSCSEVFC